MVYESYEKFVEQSDAELQPLLLSCYSRESRVVFEKMQELGWPEVVDAAEVFDSSLMGERQGVGRRMKLMGYERYVCPTTKDGRWKLDGKRRCLYLHRRQFVAAGRVGLVTITTKDLIK